MGSHEGLSQPDVFYPNGLLPDEAASVTRVLDLERWAIAEERIAELIGSIQPNKPSEDKRNAVANYVQQLITKCFSCVQGFYHKCIESLVGVIENHKLADVKMEATWAILNAIDGANNHQIICLKNNVKPLWDSLDVFSNYPPIVCACLESLVRKKWVEVTCNGEVVNDAEFKKCLGRLQERQVQLADDIEGYIFLIKKLYDLWIEVQLKVYISRITFIEVISLSRDIDLTAFSKNLDLKDSWATEHCILCVFPGGQENNELPFIPKHFNVIDPLRANNNLGRSVSKGNFFRIRSAFAFEAEKLARLFDCPRENVNGSSDVTNPLNRKKIQSAGREVKLQKSSHSSNGILPQKGNHVFKTNSRTNNNTSGLQSQKTSANLTYSVASNQSNHIPPEYNKPNAHIDNGRNNKVEHMGNKVNSRSPSPLYIVCL
ncbi:hypothetical protein POM88_018508 [Heracleum sosnowskyi]|uniref:PAP/OAS1 substrate-binding-related domain-containing protein n=1 Tax=Heracleum sosnowskyi TaxID=360622 RepID=A0AAD8MUT2_9APIA|nr:hypothetical protein POM88_018508 [Heracleum sosnowskyi]